MSWLNSGKSPVNVWLKIDEIMCLQECTAYPDRVAKIKSGQAPICVRRHTHEKGMPEERAQHHADRSIVTTVCEMDAGGADASRKETLQLWLAADQATLSAMTVHYIKSITRDTLM